MDKSTKTRRSGWAIALRLVGLINPMLPVMMAAILMGTAGFLCAIFITVFGGYALLDALGFYAPLSLVVLPPLMLVFALLRGILRYAEQAANHYIAFKILAMIRDKVFKALRHLAPAKLETKDKGNLISVITTDIELLEVFYAHTVSPVAIALLVSLLMLVFVAQYHWLLALILLFGYLATGLGVPLLVSSWGRQAGEAYRRQSGQLGSATLDNLRGLREVLQFRQGEKRLEEMEAQTRRLDESHRQMKRYEGLTGVLCNSAIIIVSIAVLFCGVWLYQLGAVGFDGVLISFIAAISSFGPTVALANLSNNLLLTFASADRVLDILDETPTTPEVTDGVIVPFEGMRCEDVSFAYDDEPVLRNYCLEVPRGRVIGIQGKSGSGKSTVLRLLMRFWDVDEGAVAMSGQNVRTINTCSLRRNQGFLTQETVLFNDTLENNIKVANLNASRAQVEEACRKAAIDEFIQSLPKGYDTLAGELGEALSGGERQRIGLARAFLHNAPMLLLDEPTSNLDSLNEGIILKSLEAESRDKTVVLVSHRASSLGVADEVVRVNSERAS